MNGYTQNMKRETQRQDLETGLMARLEIATMCGEKLVREYRERVAWTLMAAGIQLIPSDDLKDHQYVVSRGVYDAAKRVAERGGP